MILLSSYLCSPDPSLKGLACVVGRRRRRLLRYHESDHDRRCYSHDHGEDDDYCYCYYNYDYYE